mgnify:FL=1
MPRQDAPWPRDRSLFLALAVLVRSPGFPASARNLTRLRACRVATSLLQIGNPRISAASIRLLAAVLEGLDARGFFKGDRTMEEVLLAMQPNEGASQAKYMSQLQQYSGVDFRQHLSFGIATLVTKSLHHAPSTADAIDFLFKLLLCSRRIDESPVASPTSDFPRRTSPRQVPTAAVGYFLVLLPIMVRQHRLQELQIGRASCRERVS